VKSCGVGARIVGLTLCALLALPGCSKGKSGDAAPPATVPVVTTTSTTESPSTTSTTLSESAEAAEVVKAYLHAWDVLAKAGETLDSVGLAEAFAGGELENLRRQVEEQRARNQPVKTSVEHHVKGVTFPAPDTAVVADEYLNHSVFLQRPGGPPGEPDPNETLREVWTFKRSEGGWIVTDVRRQ
jgi:predicted lipid-binding transport protein (Tim44 family)